VKEGLEKYFKLRKPIATSNMTLFNAEGKVYRYATELDIVRDFTELRMEYYHKRKEHQVSLLRKECAILSNRLRFIGDVIEGKIKIHNRKRVEIVKDLTEMGYDTMSALQQQTVKDFSLSGEVDVDAPTENTSETHVEVGGVSSKDYDYLVGMPLWSLSYERISELEKQKNEKEIERQKLENTSPKELWLSDLDDVVAALDQQDELDSDRRAENAKFRRHRRASLAGMKKVGGRGRVAKPKSKTVPKKTIGKGKSRNVKLEDGSDMESVADSLDNFIHDDDDDDDDDDYDIGTGRKRASPARTASVRQTTSKKHKRPVEQVTLAAKSAENPFHRLHGMSGTTGTDKQTKPTIKPESPRPVKGFSLLDRLKSKKDSSSSTTKAQPTLEQLFASAGIGGKKEETENVESKNTTFTEPATKAKAKAKAAAKKVSRVIDSGDESEESFDNIDDNIDDNSDDNKSDGLSTSSFGKLSSVGKVSSSVGGSGGIEQSLSPVQRGSSSGGSGRPRRRLVSKIHDSDDSDDGGCARHNIGIPSSGDDDDDDDDDDDGDVKRRSQRASPKKQVVRKPVVKPVRKNVVESDDEIADDSEEEDDDDRDVVLDDEESSESEDADVSEEDEDYE